MYQPATNAHMHVGYRARNILNATATA